jgi:hypothetical protein
VLLFASGAGIAAAKALIECTTMGGLTLAQREDARLYYSAPVDAELAFTDKYAAWEARGVKVRPAVLTPAAGSTYTPGGVREAFDADDVMYDPALTAAVIFGDAEFEKEARCAPMRDCDAALLPDLSAHAHGLACCAGAGAAGGRRHSEVADGAEQHRGASGASLAHRRSMRKARQSAR